MAVQLPEYVDFIRLSDDRALLAGPATTKELRGDSVALVEQALPSLREGTTDADLAATLEVSTSLAGDLIAQLRMTGVLQTPAESRGYWEWAGPVLGVDADTVQESDVAVLDQSACGLSETEEYPFDIVPVDDTSALNSALPPVDLLLTLTVGESPEFHRAVVPHASETATDWIPARLTGTTVTVGPFGTPTTQGCYNCYDQRRRASTELSPSTVEFIHERPNQDRTPYSTYIYGFLIHVLLTEAVAALGDGQSPQSSGAIVECDLATFTMERREILPIPGCELCGTS